MSEVTEIIEESTNQVEIVEAGIGQIEVVGDDKNTIEVVFSSSIFNDNTLNVTPQTNILTIESPSDSTEISVTDQITNLEVTSTITNVEIVDKTLLSGSFELPSFTTIINNPFKHVGGTDRIGTVGVPKPIFNLQVSGSLFSDIASSSKNIIQGNGTDDLLLIKVGNEVNPKVRINPQGVILLDDFTFTPTAHEGGLLYSGSEFYLGLR